MIYKNPFFKKDSHNSKEFYESEYFEEYKGFQIFHREKSKTKHENCFDIVQNSILISQRVSLESCKKHIESLIQKHKQ